MEYILGRPVGRRGRARLAQVPDDLDLASVGVGVRVRG